MVLYEEIVKIVNIFFFSYIPCLLERAVIYFLVEQ